MALHADQPLHPGRAPRADWARLTGETFDVLVVGGGIHGAGAARCAALLGLRTAVIDRGDWASGTSSRSSKLLHGGLRYLREGEIGLVRESLRERELHLRLAPGHVSRLRFRVPRSRWGPPRWQVRAGVALYDLLTLGASRARPWDAEPSYLDAHLDDARFCLDVILDARRRGAVALNYVTWTAWERDGARVTAARVRDRLSGEEGVVRAGRFVNAAGPWAAALAPEPLHPGVRLTRGTHVVLEGGETEARLVFSPDDGRALFLLPFGPAHAMFGTTDVDAPAPDPDPRPDPEEIRYLARAFRAVFPERERRRPVGVFSGLRPLVDAAGRPSAVSREERIEAGAGVISIVGGKYTTYRPVAARAVAAVCRDLGRAPGPDPTRDAPIPASPEDTADPDRIARAFAEEDAVRVEDVLLRRTRWGLTGTWRGDRLEAVLEAWRSRFQRTPAETETEAEAFTAAQTAREETLRDWEGGAAG